MAPNDIFRKPFQLKFIRPAEMLLFSNAICDPPLGQITVIPSGQQHVRFTILLESSRSFAEQPWEVTLWHNAAEGASWIELPLSEETTSCIPLAVSTGDQPQVYRRSFIASLRRPSHKEQVRFTYKYRVTASKDWRWANETQSTSDGEVVFQSEKISSKLSDFLDGPDSSVEVKSIHSESPEARLWSLVAPVRESQGSDSGWTKTSLGIPRTHSRWFACVRTWSPWLAPRHGSGHFAPQQGALLASFLRWDGLHFVILAVSGVKDILTVLEADGKGNIITNTRNDRDEQGEAHLLAAAAKTFNEAAAAVMYQARHIVAADELMDRQGKLEMEQILTKDAKAEWMENWYDGLTYCTWNSLGQDLTEEKIFRALADLKKNNINVTNLIIDDNWQTLEKVGSDGGQWGLAWSDFEANPEGFPHGLKHTASFIREKYPNIQHIAVWHAILGYWSGIDPNGNIAKKYKTRTVNKGGGQTWTLIDPKDIDRMYDDFYKFLLSSGIDSVKTDAQFMLDDLQDAPDRRELITTTIDAWTIAALRYFSIKAISCMSQFPQCIFHTQLPTNKPQFMVRNSDDFFPDIPSSHPYHLFTNAHNALFTSLLNIIPDWDMFQTHHDYSYFHAAGRCVSGGPVYITDEPGQHNLDLIAQMTAQDVTGKTIVLRPSVLGKSVNVYTAYEEERLLRVGTFCGGKGGTSVLALFNVSKRSLLELVNLNSFPGVETGQEYVVRAHRTAQISDPMSLDSKLPIVSMEVDVKGSEILSAYPLRTFSLDNGSSKRTQVAVLGLIHKFTGAAAVLSTDIKVDEHGRLYISTKLKALGTVGIYVSSLGQATVGSNFLILLRKNAVPEEFVKVEEKVLQIDIENAWRTLKLDPGYSNEVEVEIVMSV